MPRVLIAFDATEDEAKKIIHAVDEIDVDWGPMPPSVAWAALMNRFPQPGGTGWILQIRTDASAALGGKEATVTTTEPERPPE